MTTDTKRLKEFATKCAGIELYGHLECDSKTWTLRDHEGEVLELRRRDQRTLHFAEYVMQAKPLVVRDLIYQNEDLLEKVDTLTKEITPYRRMMLSACAQLGQIGEALGLSMDDDADTMLGTIAANAQALRCNQEASKILAASNKALFDDLVIAAETLRRYEALHRAKGTDDSLKKAEVNAELASRFEATIAQAGQSQGLDVTATPASDALQQDAERYRFVRELAWYVDAAAHAYNVANVNARWSDQRGSPDWEETQEAVDKARLGTEGELEDSYT